MPISANAVWNLTASATGTSGKNGGFFVAGATGTNYSLQNGAQYALTGVTSVGAGNVILTASAADDMVGNGLFVVSGTNFTSNSWFEITSVVVGVSITVSTNAAGTAICTGVGAIGVVNIGGANHLNSTLADDMFEAGAAGNYYYIKSGTYTVGESISITRAGTTSLPISIIGYTSTHGDACAGSSRPVLDFTTFTLLTGSYFIVKNLILIGTAAAVATTGTGANRWDNIKIINKSTTAARTGLRLDAGASAVNCEAICYRGYGFVSDDTSISTFVNCYAHDCATGFRIVNDSYDCSLIGCTAAACYTYAIHVVDAAPGPVFLKNNTIMGRATTPLGVGLYFTGALFNVLFLDNIITGLSTGVSGSSSYVRHNWSEYNNFFGNTTDVSNWTKGSTDIAINPSFANVTQVSGSTATTSASNQLVQAGATFISSGVTAGRDYVYIESGTGVTAGVYGILSVDSETQITVDITLTANATANKVFYIHCGHNYQVGGALKAAASPLTGNPDTITYIEPGAAQRREKGTTVSAFIG